MSSSEDEVKTRHPKSQLDEQRLKIEKLMANPVCYIFIKIIYSRKPFIRGALYLNEYFKELFLVTHNVVKNLLIE